MSITKLLLFVFCKPVAAYPDTTSGVSLSPGTDYQSAPEKMEAIKEVPLGPWTVGALGRRIQQCLASGLLVL